jgi:APA family basic amino acid/polyamine antiporter
MIVYTALNAVFLLVAPASELKGQLEVGLIAGRHIFGQEGGRVVGAIICLGLLSAISSMTWIGPRVTMSMGEDHWLLRFLGRKNGRGVPVNAIIAQMVIVSLLLLTRSFEQVVIYIQFSLLLCSFLTVVGVIVLRKTRPDLRRPYLVWAYPLPVLIFSVITAWMMIYLLYSHPIESLCGLGTMFLGLVLYFGAERHLLTR